MDKINDTTIRLLSMNDIKKPGRLIAKTGDINGRDLYVQMEGDACRGLNTEGVRLTLAYKTPSGKVGELLFENVDGEEGIFKVTLGEEVTSSAGIVTLAIRVNRDGRLVETPNFDLYVEGSPFVGTIAQPEEPEPEPEIPTLDGIEYTHEYEEDKHDVIYIETDRLYLGEEEVIQFPQKGEYYIIYGEFYNGDELLKREEVYRIVVKERRDYLIEVGTKVREEPVEPEEDFEYRDLPDGTVEITKYNGNDSDRLEVPETLGGKEVSSIGVGAYEGKSFKWVIITGDIKNIGDFAFKDSKTIETVDFNGYVERIGEESFKGNNMIRVVIPKGVKFIGKDAFEDNRRSREGGMFEILAERGTVAEDYAKEYGYEFREFREFRI